MGRRRGAGNRAVCSDQGEELGLFEVEDIPKDQIQDPIWARNFQIEKGRDGCRVPLPWISEGTSFGFGSGGSHLPQPQWFKDFSVEIESGKAGSSLEIYRSALALRKKFQSTEEYSWVRTGRRQVLHFVRENGWACITNFSGRPFKLPKGEILLATGPLENGKLPKNTTVWLKN